MLQKLQLTLLALLFAATSVSASVVVTVNPAETTLSPEMVGLFTDGQQVSVDDFLTLTPKKIREITGKKLTLKETIGLKYAQKKVKRQYKKALKGQGNSNDPDIDKGLFIACAILLPIAAIIFMGMWDDWEGNTWWVALILYALCYIPGLIYTLTKMKNYY